MKTDLFITYHHSDELAARWIAAVLKDVPFSLFMESWDFLPGQLPIEKIEHMITIAPYALVLLSDRFLQSGVDDESLQAVTERFNTNAVILFRIDSCDVEKTLRSLTYTDLFGIKEAEARKRLLTAVGIPTTYKKETEWLQVTAKTRKEVLEKRKAELEELLTTTIKHNYHMKLDLEQEVEKEVKVKNEKTREMEMRKEWVWERVPLETVLKDGKNYILVNPSGMGKTTFLTYVACTMLDREADYPFLPIFFTCIGLNNRADTIEKFILSQVESFYTHSQGSLLSREWENLCVLIDALDQARDVDDIVSSLQLLDKPLHYKKAKIILSSRQNTADKVKEGFEKIRLKLPEADEVQHYLGEENYKKLGGIIEVSEELVKAPVLLEMLKTIAEKEHVVSKLYNRSGLYTAFTKILLDQERSKPRFWQDPLSVRHFIDYELEQALEKIAFFSLVNFEILVIPKERLVQYCESPEKKEALLNIGIILEFFEDRQQKIVFRHQSFQAYFAARYMYYRQPELFKQLMSDIGFFYNDVWYEVIRFFVGLEKNPKKADAIIEAIIEKDKGVNVLKKTIREIKRKFKVYYLTEALRLIFVFSLMSEVRVSREFVQKVYEEIGDLLHTNKRYLGFFFSNRDKFNKSNDEQLKNIFFTFVTLFWDKHKDVRRAAVEAFGKIFAKKGVSFLEPLLKYENEYVRRVAIDELRKVGTVIDIPILIHFFRDENSYVRRAAVYALGKIGSTQDIPFLEPLLRDKESTVRKVAAEALGKIGTANYITLLEPLFRDKNEYVRRVVAEAVGKIGTAGDIPFLEPLVRDEDSNVRRAAAGALGKICTAKDVRLLEPMLRDKNEYVRRAAIGALENICKSKDIPLLKPLLKDEDWKVRMIAVKTLRKIGTAKNIPLLKPLLRDKHKDVRRVAVEVLRKIGTSKDIPLLDPMIRDKEDYVREAAAEALGNICTSEHIPLLEPLLRDENEYIRCTAIETLMKIGTSEHIPLLEPLLKDNNWKVRSTAKEALAEIIKAGDIPLLKTLLRDKDKNVSSAAAYALGKIGNTEHIPLLEPLFRYNDWYVRSVAYEALGKIISEKDILFLKPLLKDDNNYVRSAAIKALGKIGTAKDILLLEPLFRDENWYVRHAATEVLGRIGTEKNIPLLEPLIRDKHKDVRRAAVEVLRKIGTTKNIPLLEPLLRDEDWDVRRAAVKVLRKIGTAKNIPLLEPLLRDEDSYVRSTAAEAFENIVTVKDIPLIKSLLRDENSYVRHAAVYASGKIGTTDHIPLLKSLLRDEGWGRNPAKAIEKIYKRSTLKLHIDEVLQKSEEKEPLFLKIATSHPLHILHISDIHYALENDPFITRIFHEFLLDIQKWRTQQNNQNIHAICLTGDIAQSGQKNQYISIDEKINTILNTAGCSRDDIFIIPGNHDVQEYDKISDKGKTTLDHLLENKMNIDTHVLNNFENCREFHEKFSHYYEFIETSGYTKSLMDKYRGIPKPWYSKKLKAFPVRIIGLNSALFCLKDYNKRGKIRMGTSQFDEAYFKGKPGKPSSGEVVILLTHHPIDWLEETEKDELKTLIDRYSVIHLHGHVHRLDINEVRSHSGSTYISIGTGSIYGEKGTKDINTYHIMTLDFENEEIRIWSRRWVPEFGMWTVFADNSRNIFSFPKRGVVARSEEIFKQKKAQCLVVFGVG